MRINRRLLGAACAVALVLLAAVTAGANRLWNPRTDAVSAATPAPAATAAPTPSPAPQPTEAVAPQAGSASAGRDCEEQEAIHSAQKMIALTFDDGPGAATSRILRALDRVGGHATFFMVGQRLSSYADTARSIAAQGSELATHSWDHPNLTKLSADEIRTQLTRSLDAIERVTGVRPTLLRPPYGSVNDSVRSVCRELGLRIANWNIDPQDWKSRDAQAVKAHILSHAKDGGIVVCHDLYSSTAGAVESAVQELADQGYALVTVSELLQARRNGGTAGKLYCAAA